MAKGRKTGGRQKGTPNKATADIKALASVLGGDAISTLERLMREGETEQIRFAACKELLDRGYGRARQTMDIHDSRLEVVVLDRYGGVEEDESCLTASTSDRLQRPSR